VKTLAFVLGLCIVAVGLFGILVPSGLLWVARIFVSSGAVGFYVDAAVRVALGLILISVASASRVPRALRIVGYAILLLGIITALVGLGAAKQGSAEIDWWLHQSPSIWRFSWALILVLGSFIAYACTPRRRSA
jgi:hypothetical protein